MTDQPQMTDREIQTTWEEMIDTIAMTMHDIAKKKGWYDPAKTTLEACALIHSEVSEASEELRGSLPPDSIYFSRSEPADDFEVDPAAYEARKTWERYETALRNGGEASEPSEADIGLLVRNGLLKPEGFGVELADAVIRIMDTTAYNRISLGTLIRLKAQYNRTRPHRHGGMRA